MQAAITAAAGKRVALLLSPASEGTYNISNVSITPPDAGGPIFLALIGLGSSVKDNNANAVLRLNEININNTTEVGAFQVEIQNISCASLTVIFFKLELQAIEFFE